MVDIVFEKDNKRAAAFDSKENIGECTFSQSEKIWIIDHTFVNDNYKGQGLARKLVDKVVEEAKKAGAKIIPLCPYALSLFQKNEKYNDIWQK